MCRRDAAQGHCGENGRGRFQEEAVAGDAADVDGKVKGHENPQISTILMIYMLFVRVNRDILVYLGSAAPCGLRKVVHPRANRPTFNHTPQRVYRYP